MEYNLLLILVILILSAFQSIFGIGLLALGTPLLLLLNYSFEDVLLILLPCSICVSILTLFLINIKNKKIFNKQIFENFIFFSIPGIILGLTLIFFNEINVNFKVLIGSMILLSIFLKRKIKQIHLNNKFRKKLTNFIIGFIHGISNMGGSFLSIYLITFYNDKKIIRYHITLAYIFFAFTQLLFLFLINEKNFFLSDLNYLLVFSLIGSVLGNFLNKFINKEIFLKILQNAIFLSAIIIIIKSIKEIF
jgi:uncharacterized protein